MNIIIDIQPGLKLFVNIRSSLHGITHTFVGGIVIGLVTAGLVWMTRNFINRIYQVFKFNFKPTFLALILGSIFGAWLHILIDSIMHSDVKPFFPSDLSPLYQIISSNNLNLIALVLSLTMFIYLIFAIINNNQ